MAKQLTKQIFLPEDDGIHDVVVNVPICRRCHRVLKTPEAIERGMGKVCWRKTQENKTKPLFSEVKSCNE